MRHFCRFLCFFLIVVFVLFAFLSLHISFDQVNIPQAELCRAHTRLSLTLPATVQNALNEISSLGEAFLQNIPSSLKEPFALLASQAGELFSLLSHITEDELYGCTHAPSE